MALKYLNVIYGEYADRKATGVYWNGTAFPNNIE